MTIQEMLQAYIDDDRKLSGVGGEFTGKDFKGVLEVLQGTTKDFIIFNNGGGKHFHIWFNEHAIAILEHYKDYVYCYQINQEQKILRGL